MPTELDLTPFLPHVLSSELATKTFTWLHLREPFKGLGSARQLLYLWYQIRMCFLLSMRARSSSWWLQKYGRSSLEKCHFFIPLMLCKRGSQHCCWSQVSRFSSIRMSHALKSWESGHGCPERNFWWRTRVLHYCGLCLKGGEIVLKTTSLDMQGLNRVWQT